MKKKALFIPLLVVSSIGLGSCQDKPSEVIISEVLEGSGSNCALELYNLSPNEISLDSYSIEIRFSEEKKTTISLEGYTIPAEQTFVISSANSNDTIKAKAQFVSDQLLFNGNQPILLKKGKKTLDIIGVADYYAGGWYTDITLARKVEHLVGRKTFDEYDWIRYVQDNTNYLGTIEVSITERELLEGPKLTEKYLNMTEYSKPAPTGTGYVGTGGLMDVTVAYYVDGDTTGFNYSNTAEIQKLDVSQGTKMRYQNIDTPESYEGNIQEFGLVAKAYTKSRLSSAGRIRVQSVEDGSVKETFDRMLGWVWADDHLLNFDIVKRGYSNVAFSAVDIMTYKDVSYTNFLYHAQLYAQKRGLGIHGEVDPNWDYENNKVKDGIHGNEK